MPEGEYISGEDGIIELLTSAGVVIGEVPCLISWTLDATATLSERGGRCMVSNGDGGFVSNGAKATNSITLLNSVNDDTAFEVLINGNTIFYIADGLETPEAIATAAAAAINASAAVNGLIVASADGATVTITALEVGTAANAITCAINPTNHEAGGTWATPTMTGGINATGWVQRTVESKSWSASLEFFWQKAQNIPASLKIDAANIGDTLKLRLYPNTDTAGVYYHGDAIIESVSVPSAVTEDIKQTVGLAGTGSLTRAAI